jgi:hypothetical protein
VSRTPAPTPGLGIACRLLRVARQARYSPLWRGVAEDPEPAFSPGRMPAREADTAPPLQRFVEDGRLAIDNNQAENQLRIVAVGRKSWLFAGSRPPGILPGRASEPVQGPPGSATARDGPPRGGLLTSGPPLYYLRADLLQHRTPEHPVRRRLHAPECRPLGARDPPTADEPGGPGTLLPALQPRGAPARRHGEPLPGLRGGKARQWGWLSADDVRDKKDMNPSRRIRGRST